MGKRKPGPQEDSPEQRIPFTYRRSQYLKKSVLTLLLGLLFLLPALVAGVILWQTLSRQIYANYEQRLTTGLKTFELVLNSSYRNLQSALTRIATDNTLRVTMELEILPQLRRYLKAQYQVSGIDYLTLFDRSGKMTAGFSKGEATHFAEDALCRLPAGAAWAGVRKSADGLYMAHVLPVKQKNQLLGYLCGGVSLYAKPYLNELHSTLGGLPAVWPIGEAAPKHLLNGIHLPHDQAPDKMFDYKGVEGRYKGMVKSIRIGSEPLQATVLLTMEALEKSVKDALRSIVLALSLLTIIVLFGLRFQLLQRKAKAQLAEEQERALVTLSSIGDAVLTTDNNESITYMNTAAEKLTGSKFNELRGKTWDDNFSIKSEESGLSVPSPIKKSLDTGQRSDAPHDTILIRPDGAEVAVQYSAAPIGVEQSNAKGVVLVLRDVRRERQLQRALAWKASRDELTGLLNRTEFRRRLEDAIVSARECELQHGLLLLDLDQFKVVNDSCGHAVGDQLLKNVSTVLKDKLRSSDFLARLGGDEFGILLEGCPPKQAAQIAQQICNDISVSRFSHGERVFNIGVSIGVVVVNHESAEVEGLMSQADAACYAAKERGRNRIHLADIDNEHINNGFAQMQWAARIKEALRNNRFQLYFQPIVSVARRDHDLGAQHGEVLVRMLNDQGELVAPGFFMPAAERYGLMPDIDRWIIHELFTRRQQEYQEAWRESAQSLSPPSCLYTINLSGASIIDSDFFEFIQQEMETHGIAPQLVGFEITETVAITHLSQATQFMGKLRAMGCSFLLDDFGSGMSSFAYLKNLPVDYLKIDGMFVRDIVDDPIDRAMVKAINEIGHVMGLKTIAEFVENDAILHELKIIGVDMAQGYGISKPRPLDDNTLPTAGSGLAGN